jgi:hypothetical protein
MFPKKRHAGKTYNENIPESQPKKAFAKFDIVCHKL